MNIKNKITIHLICVFIAVLTTAVISHAKIGFHAELDSPPTFISDYKNVDNNFSVAIYPKTYKHLSRWLAFKPVPKRSNFAEGSIRFETQYYGLNREKYNLIPVSVDAQQYSQFRIKTALMKSLRENFTKTLEVERGGTGRSGLGVQVALPKRLQKIFGEGSAGLKISGKRRISFAGRSSCNDEATTGTSQSKFPSLVMDQVSRFNIEGTIGTKISVKVSQDSQTDIPLANRIQIRYRGDEDDVLKTIEAGNTTLSLPNTQFVGYSSRIRGLFGLKTTAQIGHLTLTAIASQEKGSSETTSITAGGEENVEYMRDYEYAERRIFDLLLPSDEPLRPTQKINKISLYESVQSYQVLENPLLANFYADPSNTESFPTDKVTGNNTLIKEIDGNKYTIIQNTDNGIPYVYFSASQSSTVHIGYWMEVEEVINGVTTTTTYGDINDSSVVIDELTEERTVTPLYTLKLLLRESNSYRPSNAIWPLMWRNCYVIPRGSRVEDIKFRILKGLDGTEQQSSNTAIQGDGLTATDYLEILGLDLKNVNSGTNNPDGVLDEDPFIFRPQWGLVIFPSRTPFDDNIKYKIGDVEVDSLEIKVPDLYDYTSWTEKSEASEYYIEKVTTTRGSIIRLNRANIIEGSERITVNGEVLQKGTDYDIQYDFGQVTLRSVKATDPNAEIKIDFEYAPFFAVQKKTLLGIRAEYEWSKDLKFGTTFLYKSDKAQERKPKVGQETARTIIFDSDISLKLHPNFITSMIDALPFIETETKSNITISAEIAQSHPNPNVNDVAYVDDFETALDNVGLGTFRTIWKSTTEPMQLEGQDYVQSKLLWHRPVTVTPVTDIYNRDTQVGSVTMRTFRMIFRPKQFLKTERANVVDSATTKTWGGIMRACGSPLQENRVKLFEVRLKGTTGKIHFDFGTINEDLNDDGNANTEGQGVSGILEDEEDTGLDGVMDADEVPPDSTYDPSVEVDPNGDNWYSFFDSQGKCPLPNNGCDAIDEDDYNNPQYYDFLNGTEGNLVDGGSSRIPDKESYSSVFTSKSQNSYFSYVLDLDNYPDSFLVEGSETYPEVPLGSPTPVPWVTYQIPIRDPDALVGIFMDDPNNPPEWDKITHVRIWMEGEEDRVKEDTIEIADWYFVQPNWRDSVIFSPLSNMKSTFVVSSISDDVDATFDPPPDVEAYEDPTTNVTEVQKALRLTFTDLNHFDTCIAVKELLSVDRYSGYRRMEMFVHGDSLDVFDTDEYKNGLKFFFRLGRDDQNYYEFFTKIKPGWDESNYVNIDFNELTALKDSALKELPPGEVLQVANDKYRVFGRPNVNEIKFLAVGVVNEDATIPISGDIWVDELRVTDVRKDVGTAGRISVGGNMADFINYNVSLKSTDPYFRGLSAATRGGSQNNLGSGEQSTNFNSSITFKLQKLLPRSWNAGIPVTFAYSKSVRTPLLRNNSDIVLPESVRLEEQRVSESKSISVSLKFRNKTSNPLFSVLLNRLNTSMSYRQSTFKDVVTPFRYGENLTFKADYNLNIKKIPKVSIFSVFKSIPILKRASKSKLSLYPNSWTMSGNFSRNLSLNDNINFKRRSSLTRAFQGAMNVDYKIFDNFVAKYNYATSRDLSRLELIHFTLNKDKFKLGLENQYLQKFSLTYDPKLLSFFTSSFTFRSSYTDNFEVGLLIPSRRSALTRSTSVGGTFNHQAVLGGKKASSQRTFSGRRGGQRKNVIEEENKTKKKFYEPVLVGLRKLTGWINPIKYNYSSNFSNTLPGMIGRPSASYLFGFKDEADIEIVESQTAVHKSNNGESYDISSGFTLLGGLVTTVKFRRSITRDLIKTTTKYENVSENWPELNIRIKKFRHLPLIQKYVNRFIEIFSPRTGYSKSVKTRLDITDATDHFIISKSTSISYSPLLQVNFKLFKSLSLNSSVSRSQNINDTFNSATKELQSTSTTTKNTFALSSKYSFTSPHGISIPIFGRLKFKSTVDISMNVKFNSSITENERVDGVDNVTNDKSTISFNPIIAYSFSRQIKGGITMRWQDVKGTRTSHTREVQLWTEITF